MIDWASPVCRPAPRAARAAADPARRASLIATRPARRRAVLIHAAASLATLAVAAAGLVGCDGTVMAPRFGIATTGFPERNGTVTLAMIRNGAPMPASAVVWQGTPAGTVTITAAGVAHFTDTGAVTITATSGTNSAMVTLHVGAPPTIVFDMQDSGGSGDRNVYRMALDGGDLLRLTSSASDNEQPTVAGGTVVFTSFRDGFAALYQVAATGGTETALTGTPANALQPALSADGTRLAFIAPFGGANHLWTANADGSGAAPAAGGTGFADAVQASPNWGPHGDSLVVTTTQYGNAAIARLAVSTGSEQALTNGSTTDIDAAWSSDGKTVVFASSRDGDLGLFTLPLPGGAAQRLSPHPSTSAEPAWLRDGRIVFTTAVGSTTELRWMDPAHPDSGQLIPTPVGSAPRRAVAGP